MGWRELFVPGQIRDKARPLIKKRNPWSVMYLTIYNYELDPLTPAFLEQKSERGQNVSFYFGRVPVLLIPSPQPDHNEKVRDEKSSNKCGVKGNVKDHLDFRVQVHLDSTTSLYTHVYTNL